MNYCLNNVDHPRVFQGPTQYAELTLRGGAYVSVASFVPDGAFPFFMLVVTLLFVLGMRRMKINDGKQTPLGSLLGRHVSEKERYDN